MGKHNYEFKVDVNVINHLGVGLYSSTPAALTELVANAWDADAKVVTITVDPTRQEIIIEDDGHGMAEGDIKGKFLNVGYSRRKTNKKNMSDSGFRRVMGRKGIGKLAMFALAEHVSISSLKKGAEAVGVVVDVPKFRSAIESNRTHVLEEFSPNTFKKGHGTRIEMRSVLPGLKTTEAYLRVKLARRFSVLGGLHDFSVMLNGREITKEDRGFYKDVQFLWVFDTDSRNSIEPLAKSIAQLPFDPDNPEKSPKFKCIQALDPAIKSDAGEFRVTGYIASVAQPKQLGSKEDSANMLSIFANGRVFAEDVLTEASSAKYYQSYLVGEIHADFLDDDDIDRATASREAIKKDDPKYRALIGFIRSTLESVGDQWDEWRNQLGLDENEPENAAVLEYIASLTDKRDQQTAKRLMTSIKNSIIHPDEIKNNAAKKLLYRGAIIGFEKLRLKKQLDKLGGISDVLSPEFAAIFATLDQVEESAYADITRQRLEVIKKFAGIADDADTLERVAQTYLFKNLWLLDPSWDRVRGRAELEKTLTAYLKRVQPDSTGARLDISYRASSGRHIVVELKRPGKTSLNYFDLYQQASKYKDAVEAYYNEKEPNKPAPSLDIYLLVAKTPTGFDESKRRSLAEMNGRIITYSQLINDARNTYQEYLDASHDIGRLEALLARV